MRKSPWFSCIHHWTPKRVWVHLNAIAPDVLQIHNSLITLIKSLNKNVTLERWKLAAPILKSLFHFPLPKHEKIKLAPRAWIAAGHRDRNYNQESCGQAWNAEELGGAHGLRAKEMHTQTHTARWLETSKLQERWPEQAAQKLKTCTMTLGARRKSEAQRNISRSRQGWKAPREVVWKAGKHGQVRKTRATIPCFKQWCFMFLPPWKVPIPKRDCLGTLGRDIQT